MLRYAGLGVDAPGPFFLRLGKRERMAPIFPKPRSGQQLAVVIPERAGEVGRRRASRVRRREAQRHEAQVGSARGLMRVELRLHQASAMRPRPKPAATLAAS